MKGKKRIVKAPARKGALLLLALSLIFQITFFPAAVYAADIGSTAEIAAEVEPPKPEEESRVAAEEEPQIATEENEHEEEPAPQQEARKLPLYGEVKGTILAEKVPVSEICEGDQIVIVYEPLGTAVSLTPARTSRLAGCEVTMGETATREVLIDAEDDLAVLEVVAAESEGDFYFKSEKGYLTAPTTGNGLYYASEPEDGSLCRFVGDSFLHFPGIEHISDQDVDSDSYLEYYSGGPYFSSYTKSASDDPTPYELAFYRTNDIESGEELVGRSYVLPVFETSDTHGHLADISSTPYKYLLAFISDKVKDVRGGRDDLAILLDGGDIYQGNTLSNLMRGQPIAAAYEIMGYDAVTIGNHDFDWGLDATVDADRTMMDYVVGDISGENHVPVVCSNIYQHDAKTPLADDYVILHKTAVDEAGNEIPVNVCVIGFAGSYGTSIKYDVFGGAGYSIKADYDRVNEIAASLEESGQCDATILLVHEEAAKIAERLGQDTAVDLVFGGHTHYNSNAATSWNLRYLQPAANGGAYALAKMAFKVVDGKAVFDKVTSGRIFNVKADLSLLTNEPQNADELDPELVNFTDYVAGLIRDILEHDVGYITESVVHRTFIEESGQRATTAGNWITSIFRRIAGADVAFINTGGLRADFEIPEGQDRRTITLSDIYTMFPFGNAVCCFEITYEELLAVFQYALTSQGKILFAQMTGVDCYYTGTTVNAIVVGGPEELRAGGGSRAARGLRAARAETGVLRATGVEASGEPSSETSDGSAGITIYANGKWKEGWKDKKLRVAMTDYMMTTNRVTSEGQSNPFYEWKDTDKLLSSDQIDNEEAVVVLTAESEANDGHLFIDTAPHFIEKENEDIDETEELDDPEPEDPEPDTPDPEPEPDPENPEPRPDDPDPGKTDPENTSGQGTENSEAASEGESTAPKVGDPSDQGIWLVLIAAALLGLWAATGRNWSIIKRR